MKIVPRVSVVLALALALVALMAFTAGLAGAAATDPIINEFVANHTGNDTNEFVEIKGDADTDYSAFTVLHLEGDSVGAGTIDTVIPVSITNASGYWATDFMNNEIENGTITLLLVEGFSGADGDDLDTDDDGSFDVTPWTRIVDDVAVNDGGGSDLTYSSVVLASGFDGVGFTPGGASRIPDGTDTDAVGDWLRNDFDGEGFSGFTGTPEDGEAGNTPGAENVALESPPPPPEACGDPYVAIYDIQGATDESPEHGNTLSTEGIVTGDFQGADELNGFFIQDATGDGDGATSDGIFVYAPGGDDVAVGDHVRVGGEVDEQFGLTRIENVTLILDCGDDGTISPTSAFIDPTYDPLATVSHYEKWEGMLVTWPDDLIVIDTFALSRFGEAVLTHPDVMETQYTPSQIMSPTVGIGMEDSGDSDIVAEMQEPSRVIFDDGSNSSFVDPVAHVAPGDTLRVGDTVTDLTGVLSYDFGFFRMHATSSYAFDKNPRPAAPDAHDGTITVASYNLLNYWTTIDTGSGIPRGADSEVEFTRQVSKTVASILAFGADIVAVQELENNEDVAVAHLVDSLNEQDAEGDWAYIPDPGYPGGITNTNAIIVGIIYQSERVTPVGSAVWSTDPAYATDRPPLAQTFDANGEIFTVVSNHFKSKGCSGATGADEDQGDGQACFNARRTEQAEAQLAFVAQLQLSSGDDDVIVLGDLNSYPKEDPVVVLNGGLTNQTETLDARDKYSYQFGVLGELDYAYTTSSLNDRVRGVDIWHINAAEPTLVDYNDGDGLAWDSSYDRFRQDGYYAPDLYRASDHDPVILGFCDAVPPVIELTLSEDLLWPPNHKLWDIEVWASVSDNFDPNPSLFFLGVTSNEDDNGKGDGNTNDDIKIVDDSDPTHVLLKLRAERAGGGDGRYYTISYEATDSCGNVGTAEAVVMVPHDRADKALAKLED